MVIKQTLQHTAQYAQGVASALMDIHSRMAAF
jgi:hypothetical protein